jgi:hypothetical protein
MRSTTLVRTISLGAAVALALGAFLATPALAGKAKKCGAYKPGADGAGKPITLVTDAATKDKPVSVTVSTQPGAGFSSATEGGDMGPTSHAYANVQVVSKAASAKLYVRLEFTPIFDYDLFLRTSDGTAVAYSAGGAPYAGPLDGTGNGGHSEAGAENIDGALSARCSGYTVDVSSATTPGGDVTVKYWLAK